METLYVTFNVKVSNEQYAYQGTHAEAEMVMQVPRSLIQSLDPGSLLTAVLQAALEKYDAAKDGEEDSD